MHGFFSGGQQSQHLGQRKLTPNANPEAQILTRNGSPRGQNKGNGPKVQNERK